MIPIMNVQRRKLRTRKFQLLGLVVCALCILEGLTTRALSQGVIGPGEIQIDPPVAMSPPGAGFHIFAFGNLKIDPQGSGSIVACGMRDVPQYNQWQGYLYESKDGGLTWATNRVDSFTQRVSEVSCAYGPDGAVYYVAAGWNPEYMMKRNGYGFSRFFRSTDGGAHWSRPILREWLDHARSAVDVTSGPYHGRLYMFGNTYGFSERNMPILVSDDDGKTLRGPVFPPKPWGLLPGSYPINAEVLDDGTAVGLYASTYSGHSTAAYKGSSEEALDIVSSRDGGKSFEQPITIVAGQNIHPYYSSMAVDRSSPQFRGRLYAAWLAGTWDKSRVMLASSNNEGKSWSTPIRIDEHRLQRSVSGVRRFAASTSQ